MDKQELEKIAELICPVCDEYNQGEQRCNQPRTGKCDTVYHQAKLIMEIGNEN